MIAPLAPLTRAPNRSTETPPPAGLGDEADPVITRAWALAQATDLHYLTMLALTM